MEIAYSGDAFHTYMVISSEEWGENEDEEKMMSNQSTQVLLPFQVQRLNDSKKLLLRYQRTDGISKLY